MLLKTRCNQTLTPPTFDKHIFFHFMFVLSDFNNYECTKLSSKETFELERKKNNVLRFKALKKLKCLFIDLSTLHLMQRIFF